MGVGTLSDRREKRAGRRKEKRSWNCEEREERSEERRNERCFLRAGIHVYCGEEITVITTTIFLYGTL